MLTLRTCVRRGSFDPLRRDGSVLSPSNRHYSTPKCPNNTEGWNASWKIQKTHWWTRCRGLRSTCCNKARDIPLKARAYETPYFYEVRLKRVRVVPAACTSLFRSTLHFIIVHGTYRMTNEISLVWAWSLQDKVNRIHAETLAQSCGSKSASIGTPVGMCPYIGFGFGTEGIQFQWLSNGARPGNIKFTAVCSMWLLKLRFSGLDQQEKAVQKPQTSRGEEPPVTSSSIFRYDCALNREHRARTIIAIASMLHTEGWATRRIFQMMLIEK